MHGKLILRAATSDTRPRRTRRIMVLLAAGMLVAPATALLAGTASASTATTAGSTATHMVPAVLEGLPLATLLGPAPADQDMTVGVSLERPNTAGENELYNELYDPSSPMYEQFLTPVQFDQEFGVSSSQSEATENWLTSGGLTIETTPAAGD
jgi:hypothetical protein